MTAYCFVINDGTRVSIHCYEPTNTSSIQSINTKQLGDRMKQGIETMITEAEAGLGLKAAANKPYKGREPMFSIDDESGLSFVALTFKNGFLKKVIAMAKNK